MDGKKCLRCDKRDERRYDIDRSDYTCVKCGAAVQAKKRCHSCKALSDIDSLVCSRCGSPDIVECYLQSCFKLTESGKKVARKLANEAQVESLLEEINS